MAVCTVLSSKRGAIVQTSGVLRRRQSISCNSITYLLTNASNGQVGKDVIVKAARPDLFENEVRTLENFRGHRSFRQLVDVIQDQPMLVLEYLDTNIQHVVNQRPKRRLEDLEVKFVAKVMLEGLDRMHELKMVHTGMSQHTCRNV